MIETIPTIGIAMPTAADWGQLYQFNGTGDAGLILPPRAYYFRDFFSGQWNDMSIGIIHCECGTSGSTSALVNERQLEDNLANLFNFGISQSLSSAIDVAGNPNFVGLAGLMGGPSQVNAGVNTLGWLSPTCIYNGNFQQNGGTLFQADLSQGVTSTPFSMLGIRFIYNPINQTLYMNWATQTGISLPAEGDDVTTLTTFLQGLSGSTSGAQASFPLVNNSNLNTFYLYWPYLNNLIKLHCVGAIKNS